MKANLQLCPEKRKKDYYEPLPDFGEYGVYPDFEDKRNEIEEWIEGEFTEWMCNRCLSVITDREYAVVSMIFGLSDDEPRSYDEIAVIMNLSKDTISRIYHQALKKMRHPKVINFLD